MTLKRYKVKIEYDGTNLVGWQYQKNGLSVQEIIQNAIFKVSSEKVKLIGSGRTDSGVHAKGQIAHFDLSKKIKKESLIKAINQNLKNYSVSILYIKKTNNNFHSRFDARLRTYEYLIINRSSPLALEKNKAWHIRKKLDLKKMKKGSKALLGTHDFSAFRSSSCEAKSPIRTLNKISIKKKNDLITLKFCSKSFLQQQVRSMVGCLKLVGEKKWSIKYLSKVLKSKKRTLCGSPAPACGLYLSRVKY